MVAIPARSPGRSPLSSPFWSSRWKEFLMPVFGVCVIMQVLFLGNMTYFYGSIFRSGSRVHALKVLALDYDGGEIGESLSMAYEELRGDAFPTLEYKSVSEYPTPESRRQAVCKGGYWAVVYSHSGASDRLLSAIQGNETQYDPYQTLSYTYNGIRYPIVVASYIESNLQTLVATASRVYYHVAADARAAVNITDPATSAAFFNPIQASSSIIMPTTQGVRVFFNTVSMVMPILMQFFFLMGLNAIFGAAGVYSKMSKRDVYLLRLLIGYVFTFFAALAMAGYIWAFRENWDVTGSQFVETWMCLWFYMMINFLVVDAVLELVIPLKLFSLFMLTWIIFNVTTTVFPFELSAGFYRWGYALPSHNIWTLLISIWSGGCRQPNELEVALPILLSWWFLGHLASAWAVRKRCVLAEASSDEKQLDLEDLSRESSNTRSPSREDGLFRQSSPSPPATYSPARIGERYETDRLASASDSRTVVDDGPALAREELKE